MIFALLSLREPLEEVWYGLVSFPCQNVTDPSSAGIGGHVLDLFGDGRMNPTAGKASCGLKSETNKMLSHENKTITTAILSEEGSGNSKLYS